MGTNIKCVQKQQLSDDLPVCRGWLQHSCTGTESFLPFSDELVWHWDTACTFPPWPPATGHSDQKPSQHAQRSWVSWVEQKQSGMDLVWTSGKRWSLTSIMVTATSLILCGSTYEFWQLSVSLDANSLWFRVSNCNTEICVQVTLLGNAQWLHSGR